MTTGQHYTEPEQQHDMDTEAHPAAAAASGDTYDPARTSRVEDTAPEQGSEVAADDSAIRVGLLNNPAELRNEWQQVQGTFVDDPHQAVKDASALVDRTIREIQENVSRGHIGDSASTEDLRVSFQRYREFFQRLLSA